MRLALVAFVFLISIASFSGMSVAQEAGASNDAQQLIDLLQNDEAREALIDSLRQLWASLTEADRERLAVWLVDHRNGKFDAEISRAANAGW